MDMTKTIAHQAIYTISLILLSRPNMNGNAEVLKRNISIGISAVAVLCLQSVPLRAESAAELLRSSGGRGGLVVHVGCGDGSLTADLRAGEAYFVHGLDMDAGNVEKARATIGQLGLYGPVSVEGRGEVVLMSMAAAGGTRRQELTLDSPPVFDGLIAAGGRLYLSTVDGKLICLAGESPTATEGK